MMQRRCPNWVSCLAHPQGADPPRAPRRYSSRRPSSQAESATGPGRPAAQHAPAGPPAATPAPAPATPPGTSLVGWVTGPDSPNQTLQRFAITGTDLGIMWDNGDPANHQVLMAFGDTYGYCNVHGHQWRYNALFRSQDDALAQDHPRARRRGRQPVLRLTGVATGPLQADHQQHQQAPDETGIIPTAGVAVGRNQYLNFMSIRNWDSDGAWSTNFSAHRGVAPTTARPGVSTPEPSARRADSVRRRSFRAMRTSRWARSSSPDPAIPTCTRSGLRRAAAVRPTCRGCPPNLVPDLTKYEYWNADNGTWVPANPGAATPVIPGPVGEMSAQYNTYLKQYLVLYGNGAQRRRDADRAGTAGTVESRAAARAVDADARRHLRAVSCTRGRPGKISTTTCRCGRRTT